jgi:hypothetical protein
MPDFERLWDGLSVYLAKTPEEQAYEKGFISGKNKARRQILGVGIGFAVGWIIITILWR